MADTITISPNPGTYDVNTAIKFTQASGLDMYYTTWDIRTYPSQYPGGTLSAGSLDVHKIASGSSLYLDTNCDISIAPSGWSGNVQHFSYRVVGNYLAVVGPPVNNPITGGGNVAFSLPSGTYLAGTVVRVNSASHSNIVYIANDTKVSRTSLMSTEMGAKTVADHTPIVLETSGKLTACVNGFNGTLSSCVYNVVTDTRIGTVVVENANDTVGVVFTSPFDRTYYTLDNTTPTTYSLSFTGPTFNLTLSKSTAVKYCGDLMLGVTAEQYYLNVALPVKTIVTSGYETGTGELSFQPPGGTYKDFVFVELYLGSSVCSEKAYYTIDGLTPSVLSLPYNGAGKILLTQGCVLKAALASSLSSRISATYVITAKGATAVTDPTTPTTTNQVLNKPISDYNAWQEYMKTISFTPNDSLNVGGVTTPDGTEEYNMTQAFLVGLALQRNANLTTYIVDKNAGALAPSGVLANPNSTLHIDGVSQENKTFLIPPLNISDTKWARNSLSTSWTGKYWSNRMQISNLLAATSYEPGVIYISPITGELSVLEGTGLVPYAQQVLTYDSYPDVSGTLSDGWVTKPFLIDFQQPDVVYYCTVASYDTAFGYVEGSDAPIYTTEGPFEFIEPIMYKDQSNYYNGKAFILTAYSVTDESIQVLNLKFRLNYNPDLPTYQSFYQPEVGPDFYNPSGPKGPWEPADAGILWPFSIVPQIGFAGETPTTDISTWKACTRDVAAEFFTNGAVFTTVTDVGLTQSVMIQRIVKFSYTIRGKEYILLETKTVQRLDIQGEKYAFQNILDTNFIRTSKVLQCTTTTPGWIIARIKNRTYTDLIVADTVNYWWPGWYYTSDVAPYRTTAAVQGTHEVYVLVSGAPNWYNNTYCSGCWLVSSNSGELGELYMGSVI
jgi:hypothetical protein